jgi:hypothetical protein
MNINFKNEEKGTRKVKKKNCSALKMEKNITIQKLKTLK